MLTINLYKGTNPKKEEYGLVDDGYNRASMGEILSHTETLDVVGIMSEYCVHDSVKGICEMTTDGSNAKKIQLLLPYISTADNHTKLKDLAKELQLEVVGQL